MNLRSVASGALVCAVLVLSGCDQGRKAPGKASVQVANAAAGFTSLSFRREEDDQGRVELPFTDTRSFVYDADTYDFFVIEPTFSTTDPGRTWTFAPTLEKDTHYTFVLTEVGGEVQPVVMTVPTPPTVNAQIMALHAGTDLPAFDLYLERAGVGIAGATPRGTFSAGGQIAPMSLPSGDYELFVTAAGNPADVWLTSNSFGLLDGSSSTFVIADEKGRGTARISVLVLLQNASTVIFDRNAPSELRVINGAPDQMPRDVAIESQFSPPLFSAAAFGEPTPYKQVPVGAVKVNVTPVGNPGVLELDTTTTGVAGQRSTMLFGGASGTLLSMFAVDDGRRFNREANIRFLNADSQFPGIDFYVGLPGSDLGQLFPLATVISPGISGYTTLHPGEYDLYLRQAGTLNTLMGPTRFSVAAGGTYGVLAVDGPDATTANALFLDDFP